MARRDSIQTYSFKPGLPHELEIEPLKESLLRSRDHMTRPHRADFYHVVWVRSGKPIFLVDFKSIPMGPGTLLFIRKNRVLTYDHGSHYDGTVLRFTDGFFARTGADAEFLRGAWIFSMLNDHPLVSVKKSEAEFPRLLEMLAIEMAQDLDTHQHAALQNLLHNLLIQAECMAKPSAEKDPPGRPARKAGQRFVEMLDNDFRKGRKVADYARKLGLTEKRLQAATAEVFGKSPKALIEERVAMEAKRMLLYGEATVKEITFDLEFDEVTNFIKWFRKQVGTTPATFRARYRN